jgi:demethoxyubiquinone hydroxylase (CLK1/Coq7/Cat5 family)
LGFVEATEDEVVHHIRKHLKVLPEKDEKKSADFRGNAR